MQGLLGGRAWSFDKQEERDLEARVTSWMARHDSTSWLVSAAVLTISLVAMVLFALSR